MFIWTCGGAVPISLFIIQSDSDSPYADSRALAKHGVAASVLNPTQLPDTARASPDVLLLRTQSAAELLAEIGHVRAVYPAGKLIFTAERSASLALAGLQAGATGVLDGSHSAGELAGIIRSVHTGAYYIDQNIAQLLAVRHIKKLLAPFTTLSSREFDVFCMLAEGCGLQAIGEQLGISRKTVSNCQTLLKLKLGLHNRRDIVHFAKSHGLIAADAV